MNKSKNLYKLDDVFLILSYIMIIILLYLSRQVILYAFSNTEGIRDYFLNYFLMNRLKILFLTSAIIFLQILGRIIRSEEKILVKILDTVVMYKTISINQLQQSLDLDRSKIEKYIKKLSNIGRLNIHFDGTYVRLQLDNPGISVPNGEVALPSVSSRDDLQTILSGMNTPPAARSSRDRKFNVSLFLILFFVFWPAAFIYAARFYMTSNKKSIIEERLKKRLSEMER